MTIEYSFSQPNIETSILEFQRIFLTHVHNLLKDQDENNPRSNEMGRWVKADAANASNMKHSETLRYVLLDSKL